MRGPSSHPEQIPPIFCGKCHQTLGLRKVAPLFRLGDLGVYSASRLTPRMKRLIYGHKFYGQLKPIKLLSQVLSHYWAQFSIDVQSRKTGWQGIQEEVDPSSPQTVIVLTIPPRSKSLNSLRPGRKMSKDGSLGEDPMRAIAQAFCQKTHNAHWLPLITWCKDTVPQHTLPQKRSRQYNLADCFGIDATLWEAWSARICNPNTTLLLLDDITTTGTTLQQASKAIQSELFHRNISRENQPKLLALTLTHIPLSYQVKEHRESRNDIETPVL
jgi:predicted amidophosphoribosyltransferase